MGVLRIIYRSLPACFYEAKHTIDVSGSDNHTNIKPYINAYIKVFNSLVGKYR